MEEVGQPEEQEGKSGSGPDEERLAHTLLDVDEQLAMEQGDMLSDAVNYNVNAFVPDLMFNAITQNYKQAERIYGPKLLKEVSGFSNQSLERNGKIPEFQRELKTKLGSRIKNMKRQGLIDEEGVLTDQGHYLAQITVMGQELDKFLPKGIHGDHEHKLIRDPYGVRDEPRAYRAGDRFADVDVRQTVKTVLRRGRRSVSVSDLRVSQRVGKGNVELIYAIDASGSMRGKKIAMSKRAGIALAHKAITQKNKVGLLVFSSEINGELRPTHDFMRFTQQLCAVSANKETNMVLAMETSLQLFSNQKITKHLLILTDGMPTVGDDPQNDALEYAARLKAAGVSVSIIGIALQPDDADFCRQLTDIGDGRLLVVQNIHDLDTVVIQEYEHIAYKSFS